MKFSLRFLASLLLSANNYFFLLCITETEKVCERRLFQEFIHVCNIILILSKEYLVNQLSEGRLPFAVHLFLIPCQTDCFLFPNILSYSGHFFECFSSIWTILSCQCPVEIQTVPQNSVSQSVIKGIHCIRISRSVCLKVQIPAPFPRYSHLVGVGWIQTSNLSLPLVQTVLYLKQAIAPAAHRPREQCASHQTTQWPAECSGWVFWEEAHDSRFSSAFCNGGAQGHVLGHLSIIKPASSVMRGRCKRKTEVQCKDYSLNRL